MKTENVQKQTLTGVIEKVSAKQTVKFSVRTTKVHPIYKKRYTQLRHYVAHDPQEICKVGDTVVFVACKPISKTKHWMVSNRLTEIK